jgi:hypothetical protein
MHTHACVATHDSNTIIKFDNNTTVVGLITDDNEMVVWCQHKNLSLNVSKTKELIVDYIDWSGLRTSSSSVSTSLRAYRGPNKTNLVVKRAQQRLFPLRRMKRFSMGPKILKSSTAAPLRAY